MDRKSVDEDCARRDPEYWHIRFPTDDLDRFMWGESGVPSVSTKAVKPPRYHQEWSDNTQSDNYHCGDSSNSTMEDSPSLAASETSLDNVVFATLESPGNNSTNSTEYSPLPDKILLEDIVWKQRSGLGKYSFGLFMDAWEKKRVMLLDSGLLRYYDVDIDGVTNDPKSALDPQKCHTKQVPLGEIDLKCNRECIDDDCESSPQSRYNDGVTVQARDRPDDPGPTPFEIDITRSESNEILWRLCFESQSIQILWLSTLKNMTPVESDGLANHGFAAGDHIIRWDFLLLPVPYPIQIHGIVLEVGRNCVIIADFGLASSCQRDEVKDDSHDVIMAAWEKIKPREKNRLNVVVITDLKEIRKWSKINYAGGGQGGEKSSSKAMDFITSFLPKAKTTQAKIHDIVTEEIDTELTSCDDKASNDVEGEPEWIRPGYRPRKSKGGDDGQSVFSIDRPEDRSDRELPKSDSANLVLARTHFVLENEGLLPPYHVFYSNSECIAVWCKTGRWSTLQAAVYLVSTSVGWTKSATLITMSVAAAHVVLLPALAVGGLAVAGAPLLFLRKSQEQWDKTTMQLTDEFWRHAEPPVFVEAIKYWAKLEESQKSKSHLRAKSLD